MSRYSDNYLLQKAIDDAILDRDSFSDAYSRTGAESDEALELIRKMEALKGKSILILTDDERLTAYYSFLYAEQWRKSLSEAQAAASEIKFSAAWARRFNEVRLRKWGMSKLERLMSQANTVSMHDKRFLV